MIWLIGNRGMLGSDVESLLKQNKLEYLSSNFEVDITRIEMLRNFTARNEIPYKMCKGKVLLLY